MSGLLPSIASLGLWGYWVIGVMAFGEAFFLSSVFSPGTVVVVLGGALAARGLYGIFDMMWFVAIGTILGSQASFWLGTKGEALFGKGHTVLSAAHLERGQRFFAKYGGASIVIGHFLGPLRPIAPVVAGLSGMGGRRFLLWNIAGGGAYAIAMVSVGYFFGAAFTIIGPTTTRVGLFAGAIVVILALLWFLVSRLRHGWPFAVSILRSVGSVNEKTDSYEVTFENLGIKRVAVDSGTVKAHPKLLVTGVWCIADVQYEFSEDARTSPWVLETIKPIQIAKVDYEGYKEAREQFTKDDWIDLLMQSIGFTPEAFGRRSKLLQLMRLIPFVERNYNIIELGPKGTGKSHIYSELSPHGQLISGGEITIPKLFVNNSNGRIGLVVYRLEDSP
ncbi:BREX system Lon protease-like protein BrxL [Rhodovulum visakhapatnamense]|uniref:VTT domain-containing protein n=1 Tax=Rhodovulum visakhapatnamense TaxID=364297 RepID=A0ABS1RIX3_9RHOB|nr:BREX system Lon protease-like protein BrxL [Rhodovulum visakhapatnamense]MBL3571420.1 VTT domain-containing protein [Rhodovulum visakhapatnamense]MBL3579578.1 VTT domain-containing protein [Rhodovulum visakhapatnamense]